MTHSWPGLDLSWTIRPDLAEHILLVLDDFEVLGLQEFEPTRWRVFFDDPGTRDRASLALRTMAPDLSVALADVADEHWAQRVQAGLRSVRVGRLTIAPPWEATPDHGCLAAKDQIVIEPSMGFGTGHHATTRLCLLALQRLDLGGRRVLDVGTGSGILALAARRLGAAAVVAVDRDPDAVAAASRNISLNHEADALTVMQGELAELTIARAAVVLANLTGSTLVRHGARLLELLETGGYLIAGGLTVEEEPAVRSALAEMAHLVHRDAEDEWVTLTLRRQVSCD